MATIMSKDEEQFWLAEKEVVVCETPQEAVYYMKSGLVVRLSEQAFGALATYLFSDECTTYNCFYNINCIFHKSAQEKHYWYCAFHHVPAGIILLLDEQTNNQE